MYENQEQRISSWVSTALVITAMMVVQIVFGASQILTNLALKQDGFLLALLAYRHLFAAACIAPIAIIFDRRRMEELKEGRVWFWAFLTSLSGITMGMGLFYYGVRDTSAAYATNYSNLIPIITFLFSVIIRMEKLELSTYWGKAKGIGAIICVGGALVISLYSGPSLVVLSHNSMHHKHMTQQPYTNLLRGTLLLIASCFGYAFWFVVQAKLLEVLPSKHWSNFLTCLVAAAQCAVLGLCLDRTPRSWSLGWDVKLLCVSVSGIFASALAFYLILWAVQLKDPSYPSMFDPFSVVFVALIQAFFFGDQLSLGLLLGMILMIIGLYCYLWGKRKEELSENKGSPLISPRVATDPVNHQLLF
ncbi:hypothetical protein RND81_12G087300 [Saponaria officinalis]|uniref:WAT1-related protein n=1 Tax=Saponaria officinalis TaxID=3572 RepID=A0AAW1H883_SAPOF